jgi:exonuclease III
MKFISINIEGNKHFERLFPFLTAEKPDVVALQEIFECDLEAIKQATGLNNCVFYPNADITLPNIHLQDRGLWGVAIFAKEIVDSKGLYYFQVNPGELFVFDEKKNGLADRVLLFAETKVDEKVFKIFNTHFTWSGAREVNEAQRRDYIKMKEILESYDEVVLCGDLNTPRGEEIWNDLAKKYTDNIPQEVDTTIDKNLHKSGKDIRLVVDALFTTHQYVAKNVKVVRNTSDHMAVVGEIERV